MAKDFNDYWNNHTSFGYHADLHLTELDVDAGEHALADELEESLRIVKPDWVQVDSKGHAGVTSFFSKVPEATVASLHHDAVAAWREATMRLGLPLICHYSGFIDVAAVQKHPEWLAVRSPVDTSRMDISLLSEKSNFNHAEICPRSEYWDKLMVPQLLELVNDYHVDGFWTDGEIWGSRGCWCPVCRAEFTRRTGITDIPEKIGDAHWEEWLEFQFASALERIAVNADAVHKANPNAKFCSNWLNDLRYPIPEEFAKHFDWISGDASPYWPINDYMRPSARWLANRGHLWDLMSWPHLGLPNFHLKPIEMLCQEAATVVAAGGRYSFCEYSGGIRTSQQTNWRLKRLAKVGEFIHARVHFCNGAEPLPEVALLHSSKLPGDENGQLHCKQIQPTTFATSCLLENHYGVDILDDRQLELHIGEFKAVIVPCDLPVAPELVPVLKQYVEAGGALLLTGTNAMSSFGNDYLGISSMDVENKSPLAGKPWSFASKKDETPLYFVSDGEDGVFPVSSAVWGLVRKLDAAVAESFEAIYSSYIPESSATGCPAAVITKRGKGLIASIPSDYFIAYINHYSLPEARRFIGRIMRRLIPVRDIEVKAPTLVDVLFRKKDGSKIVHLLNTSSGIVNNGNWRRAIDEIQPLGPVTLQFRLPTAPSQAILLPDNKPLQISWNAERGIAEVTVPFVHIHCAVQIMP